MKTVITILIIIFSGSILFSRETLPLNSDAIETDLQKKLNYDSKLIKEQHEKLVAYQLQLELDKIKHAREATLMKLEIDRLTQRTYNLAFLLMVVGSFAFYNIKKQQNT